MNINISNNQENTVKNSSNNKKNCETKSNKEEKSFCINEKEKTESLKLISKEIDILKKNLEEEKNKFLRLFADFENYKKRIKKERYEIFKVVHEQIIIDLIPVLDDFERGLKELKKYKGEGFIKGIYLIQDKLIKILKEKGLKKMEIKIGDNFNTDFHEAITQISANTENLKGKIIEIIENGYSLKEKVIRHAKVITGK
ncbi:nucleotide exchange factor GrpE [Blattabacterium cuenoti]|uniref:nucleotide exchange factor GrpE n=1 Tax=Blattabacterium cuenoti TaxID=1653831 RepID=UPI00163CF981|nr:nucleotide exchange factor GrpE [Blattabacterium cuenoti]